MRPEELIRRQHRHMLALCHRLLRDGVAAQDACQEGFVRFLAAVRLGRKVSNPEAYLYQVCLNSALEILRRRRELPTSLTVDPPSGDPSPDHDMLAAEDRALIGEAIAELPPRQAQVFTARMLDGLSTARTAELLGCSTQAVRTNLCLALRAVKRLVRDRQEKEGNEE